MNNILKDELSKCIIRDVDWYKHGNNYTQKSRWSRRDI